MIYTDISGGVALVTINRPKSRNALNPELMALLNQAFDHLSQDPEVRVIVLTGEGDFFCAGADLTWMKQAQDQSPEQNQAEALGLAQLLETVSNSPMPTVAFVQGPAFGGGVGLAAACDFIVADPKAFFALSEVRLGLIPAIISPYVLRRMGETQFRRYALSAEPLSVERAYALGFVHHVASTPDGLVKDLLKGSPDAQSTLKSLLQDEIDEDSMDVLAQVLNNLRLSDEGQEGLQAFFDKRSPCWVPEEA